MSELRDLWDSHIDAGTCYLCGKPVTPDQGVYSISGAHWDCHEAHMKEVSRAVEKLNGPDLARLKATLGLL